MTTLRASRLLSTLILTSTLIIPVHGFCETQANNSGLINPGRQPPTRISMLAQYVIGRGDDEQREFAILALDLMIDAYAQVLHNSSQSRQHTPTGRRKQIAWGWATSQTIASLNHYLRRLERGIPFTLHIDHLHKILIIIDGHVVEVTGPRVKSQSRFEQQVVEFFCLTRDCSWLEPNEPEKSEEEIAVQRSLSGGAWLFQQDRTPTYVVGGLIYFKFSDFSDRDSKAALSRALADEITALILTIKRLNDNEQSISWPSVLDSQPDTSSPNLELLKGDSTSQVTITLLSGLHQADWQRLINWLRVSGIENDARLELKHLESLEMAGTRS